MSKEQSPIAVLCSMGSISAGCFVQWCSSSCQSIRGPGGLSRASFLTPFEQESLVRISHNVVVVIEVVRPEKRNETGCDSVAGVYESKAHVEPPRVFRRVFFVSPATVTGAS